MAIQLRRGDYTDFDPSQLLDGELAVVLENDPNTDDGTGLYVGFGDDNVKRVAMADETADVPIASSDTAGIVAPGDSFIVDSSDGTMWLLPANDTTLGGVKINENDAIGIQSDDYSLYIKVDGNTITTNEYGFLTAVGESAATSSTLGVVMPDGETIDVDSNGVISVINSPTPSSSTPAMDGTASAGSSTDYARADHVHPTDTSRASASDLSVHVSDTTAHVTSAERATWDAKASTDTATQSANGLMSATDKTKLDGIESGANAYELPEMSPTTRGGAKLGSGLAMDGDVLSVALEAESDGTGAGPIVELTAKGHAEQDGTPSPDSPVEIQVARGRNLLNYTAWRDTPVKRGTAVWENNGVTLTATENDCYTEYDNLQFSENVRVAVSEGQSLTLSWECDTNSGGSIYIFPNGSTTGLVLVNNNRKSLTYTAGAGVTFVSFRFGVNTAGTTIRYSNIQLEYGSTATPYVPYGCVGVDVTANGTTTTIPIPLPSRGWVGALPDGTADALTLDGAGKVVWERACDEVTFDGSETWTMSGNNTRAYTAEIETVLKPSANDSSLANVICDKFVAKSVADTWNSQVGISVASSSAFVQITPTGETITVADFKTWLSTHPVTVLYPLATLVTEDMGYVDLPDIPEGATLSVPELDALNVRYVVDDAAVTLARQWYDRARSEYEDRIVALEAAVAEIIAG